MMYVILIVVILIYFFWYADGMGMLKRFRGGSEPKIIVVEKSAVPIESDDDEGFMERNWKGFVADASLDPSVLSSHNKYVANVRQYSSGANFSAIADDNISPLQTNFLGFSRPQYVEVDPTARQVPDIDTTTLKRNRRVTFTNDYNL